MLHLLFITPDYHAKILLGMYYVEWETLKIHFILIASVSGIDYIKK